MPEKWNDAAEKKLLLEVIAASNPVVSNSVWAVIAAAMGESYTAEACRQKYQGIKRNLKPSDPSTTSTPTRNNKSTKPTKPKTPTSTTTAAKNRKRKAPKEADINEDDDEASTLFAPNSKPTPLKKKMKKEDSAAADHENGIGAELFKAEEAGAEGGIDLERDDLYEDNEIDAV